MKKLITVLFLMFSMVIANAQSKKVGLGVRLGDPTAISAKFYKDKKIAFEFNIGASPYYYGNGYYNKYWKKHHNDWRYVSGTAYSNAALSLQARVLSHQTIKDVKKGLLQWYAGGGLQYRQRKIYADYWDQYGYYYNDAEFTDYDFGVDAIIGLEYTFDDVPFSLFLDCNLFLEFINQPYGWGQAGIGARYNF